MSARDRLLSTLGDTKLSPKEAAELIDAYAHDLAEQIRANTARLGDVPIAATIRLAVNELAADLIDPGVPE